MPLKVAILAGGRSRRFGSDKAQAEYAGRRFLDRLLSAAAIAGFEATVIGRTPGPDEHWPGVPDRCPGHGPLGGLATAWTLGFDEVLLVACDLPLLTAADFAWLASRNSGPDGTVAVTDRGPEPCFARYRRRLAGAVDERLADGRRSLRGLIDERDFARVAVPANQAAHLLNVNTPADLERLL